ncbi:MAG: imidazole glycerol phosphate synthase subunit HisH [Candidatus Omnitrophota bacterium]
MKITIIDYGLGNLISVYNALEYLGTKGKISESPRDIDSADKIILPGVGSFRDAMLGLRKKDLYDSLKAALVSGKAYMGICLGLQILFEKSEEGGAAGLGVFKGDVKRFREEDGIKVPHIGWNNVTRTQEHRCTGAQGHGDAGTRGDREAGTREHRCTGAQAHRDAGTRDASNGLLAGIKDGSYFYFDHSYYADPEDRQIITGTTGYGKDFASMIHKENIYGVQFHPERSQDLGLQLLKNFVNM